MWYNIDIMMIKIGEAAKKLDVCIKTLQRWDKSGKLIAKRTPAGKRFYTLDQLEEVLNGKKS